MRSPLISDQQADDGAAALEMAIASAGGRHALGKMIHLPGSVPTIWAVCPTWYVCRVAAATGYAVTPHELRPDVYPFPEDACPRHLRAAIIERHERRAAARERARNPVPRPLQEDDTGD